MSRILSFESIPAEMFERESSDGSTEPWGDYLSQSSYKETMISSQVLSEERSEHLEDFVSVASFQSESEDVYGTPPRSLTFSAFEEPSAITYKLSFGSIPKENMKPNFVSRSPLFAHNRRNRLRIQKQLSVSDDIITEEPQPESTKDESDQQPQDPGPKVPIVWSNCICCVTVEIMCRIYETCLAICNR
ncbi:unnamed protein product [Caenorhabditis nigoni]